MFDLFKQKITYRLILPLLILFNTLVWLAVFIFPNNKPKIIFCNVGQGDAILITQGFHQMLIDGGPDASVLSCLSKYMPFFDKTIDIVALTHPEMDHFGGLIYVMDKYGVDYFISSGVGNEGNPAYQELIQKLKFSPKGGSTFGRKNLYTGNQITFGDLQLKVLWPEKRWVEARITPGNSDQLSVISNQKLTTTFPLNSFGLVFLVSSLNSHFSFLLMADVDSTTQDELLKANTNLAKVNVLKFPHHGSKTGMAEAFLQKIAPREAVVSVGKNTFGHPGQEAIDMLNKYGIVIKRTDYLGNIVYK